MRTGQSRSLSRAGLLLFPVSPSLTRDETENTLSCMLAQFLETQASPYPRDRKPKVVVTGASGRVGRAFAEEAHDRYDLTLMTYPFTEEDRDRLSAWGSVESAGLHETERLEEIFAHHDVLLHLAASARENSPWEALLVNNIEGTYNAFSAAVNAGIGTILYASSIHAVNGYPSQKQVSTHDPVRPGTLYGASKCFGEALGRFFCDREGVRFFAFRMGAVQPPQKLHQGLMTSVLHFWISHRDLNQLFMRAIDNKTLRFGIFNALSNNRVNWLDISDARELLGYHPQDDAFALHPHARDWQPPT